MNSKRHDSTARDVLEIEAKALLAARARIDGAFHAAVDLILDKCPPGKVVVMGVGKSGHVGHKIAATLASTGTPSFFVHPTEAGHGDLGMLTSNDVVLAISYSGGAKVKVLKDFMHITPVFIMNGLEDCLKLAQWVDSNFESLKKILEEVIKINWQYQTSGLNRDNYLLSL